MALEDAHARAAVDVPQAAGLVGGPCGEVAAVGVELHALGHARTQKGAAGREQGGWEPREWISWLGWSVCVID